MIFQRSPLHTKQVMNWFQSRHAETTKETYTSLPDQTHYVQTMISLFREFDKDGSNSLEKAELYGLFQKYGIAVSREELEHFFALVDRNHDSSLTLDEFKVCLQDPTANAYFREIMQQVKQRGQSDTVLPTFKKVLNQITYLEQREDLISRLNNDHLTMERRAPCINRLVNLNRKIDVQLEYRPFPDTKLQQTRVYRQNLTDEVKGLVKEAKQHGMRDARESILKSNVEFLRPSSQVHPKLPSPKPIKKQLTRMMASTVSQFTSQPFLLDKKFQMLDLRISTAAKPALIKNHTNPEYFQRMEEYRQKVKQLGQQITANVDTFMKLTEDETINRQQIAYSISSRNGVNLSAASPSKFKPINQYYVPKRKYRIKTDSDSNVSYSLLKQLHTRSSLKNESFN